MKLIITKDYETMSKLAAMSLMGEIYKGKFERINISITGGKTPAKMYEFIKPFMDGNTFDRVHYYNFDEIPTKNGPGLTIDSLNKMFFDVNNISKEQIEIFNEDNYINYDQKIKDDGGIDYMVLGLGPDGHFCGNFRGTLNGFEEGCRTVSNNMSETLHDRIEFLCGGEENMCENYVTFGPKTVMGVKKLVMIVNGKHKAKILRDILTKPIDEYNPSTILTLHPNFTVICDEDAASLLDEEIIKKYK